MTNIGSTDLSTYNLIIIGGDTALLGNNWGADQQAIAINNTNKPIIGIYNGGSVFFGNLSLYIKWGNTWTGVNIDPIKTMAISGKPYNTPYVFNNYTVYDLYSPSTITGIAVYNPTNLSNLKIIGRQAGNQDHYPIIMEDGRYLLWGFTGCPSNMTVYGKNMFLNLVYYFVSSSNTTSQIPGFELTLVIISIISCVYGIIIGKRAIKKRI
ncbi:MAG: hypothetical protein ACTSPY_04190 [Candidatus Helarchaeota archaeon]